MVACKTMRKNKNKNELAKRGGMKNKTAKRGGLEKKEKKEKKGKDTISLMLHTLSVPFG